MTTCPWCRERLPAPGDAAACPHCGKPLVDGSGERLRAIDIDFEAILAAADAAAHRGLVRGGIWAAVLGALACVPLLNVVAIFLLLVSQLLWGRFFIARHYARHFSPVRRFVTRWLSRLVVLLVLMPLHGSTFVIPLGIVTAPAVFTGINWLVRAYFRHHFLREHRRQGVLFIEKLLLVVMTFVFLLMLVVVALVAWGVLSLPGLSK